MSVPLPSLNNRHFAKHTNMKPKTLLRICKDTLLIFLPRCGVRGAFMEVVNMDPDVRAMLTKLFTVAHPNTVGQVCDRNCSIWQSHGPSMTKIITWPFQACIDCVVSPPKKGDPSYAIYAAERQSLQESLALRAKLVTDTLNSIPGVHCNEVQGSMFAFPRLDLPEKLILQAKVSRKLDHTNRCHSLRLGNWLRLLLLLPH